MVENTVDNVPAIARKNMRGYADRGKFVHWITKLSPDRLKEVLDYALARWVADGKLCDIAKELGTSESSLGRALLRHRQEEWREIQVARALTLLERAKDELEQAAPDMVPRARERLKSAQWDLERLNRRLFGNDSQPATSGINIQLNIGGMSRASTLSGTVDAVAVSEKRDSFFEPLDAENEGGGGGS